MIIIKVILLILLYIILFLLGLLLVLIISPIKGRLQFDINNLNFTGSYLFGLLKVHFYEKIATVRILGLKVYQNNLSESDDEPSDIESTDEEEAEPIKNDSKKKKEKDKKKNSKKFKRPSMEVIRLTLKTAKKLIRIIAPDEFIVRLTLGLDEPYYIGLTNLIVSMLAMPLNKFEGYSIEFVPVYDEIAIDYQGRIKINLSIIRLILPCLFYIMKKPIRQYFGILQFKSKKKAQIN